MGLVNVERRGGTAVMTYANPPFGTMTATGSQEMLDLFRPLAADAAVRCVVITGGLPGIFIRHYDVDELSGMGEALKDRPPPPPAAGPPESGFLALVDAIAAAPKPVIAATTGLGASKISSVKARNPCSGRAPAGGGGGASPSRSLITESSSTS